MMTFTIEELRRLEAEATPGPWSVDRHFVVGPRLDTDDQSHGMINGVADIYGPNRSKDAALIVAMRNDLPELLKALEWQPIETAPKDESWVILHYRDECVPIISFFSDGAWAHQETMGWNKPTHWMPLPLPPHGGVDVG